MMIDREITADGTGHGIQACGITEDRGVAKDSDESYEVDGSPRKRLTLTPITYSLDA